MRAKRLRGGGAAQTRARVRLGGTGGGVTGGPHLSATAGEGVRDMDRRWAAAGPAYG
jgi:hypothetical protein